jgi:hypothetical protein
MWRGQPTCDSIDCFRRVAIQTFLLMGDGESALVSWHVMLGLRTRRLEASSPELRDLKMHLNSKQCLSSVALAVWSLALTACLNSDKSLIDADSRVLPFTPPITIEVYDRKNPSEPWRKQDKPVTLVADNQLIVRQKDEASGDTYAFYPLEPRRFLVEGRMNSNGRFAYGVLEIRNGEGLLHHLECESIDQAAFKKAGGAVTGQSFEECKLDKLSNPLAFLKALAANPTGSQQRYVPVR